MNKKNLFIGLTVVGLIGAAIGYSLWNKPQKNMVSAKTEISIDAQTILTAFETAENEANTKYLDKVIAVKGKVKEVKNEGGKICISLETESAMSGVLCNLDPLSQHAKTTFAVGEEVVFKGVCTGFLSDVVLERCVVE
jgi:hypothetical protein